MSQASQELTGVRIWVTAQRRAEDLALPLTRRGANVELTPIVGFNPLFDESHLVTVTRAMIEDPPDFLIVTTGIGWRNWLDMADAAGLAEPLIEALHSTQIVVRGAKAHGTVRAAGLLPSLVTNSETLTELVALVSSGGVAGKRIVIQHHGAHDAAASEHLRDAGAIVTDLSAYSCDPLPESENLDRAMSEMAQGRFDAVVFTSAFASQTWLQSVIERGDLTNARIAELQGRLHLAAIGPVTAKPLVDAGFAPLIPDRSRLGSLIKALTEQLSKRPPSTITTAGELRVHASAATLDRDIVPTTPAGLEVLRLLASKPGHVFSRHEVLDVLPNNSTDPHAAEVTIARMRRAMGDSCPVRTVTKRGYQLAVIEP